MTEVAPAGPRAGQNSGGDIPSPPARTSLDARRVLQLLLAGIWLFDGVLQYQAFMFTPGFPQMLTGASDGSPVAVARSVIWNANFVQQHLVPMNALFATVQLLLGLGIAFRPTLRPALAASIAWSLGVWWFGEGLGGVLSSTASPVSGAPGAVILYALLAVLLWPADRGRPTPFTAARAVGAVTARAVWLLLWLSLAYFAVLPANRASQTLSGMITGMTDGEPGWLQALGRDAASLIAGQGLIVAVTLAAVFAVIAVGVLLPGSAIRAVLVMAVVTAAVIWVFGEALGGMLTGKGTDPNSGPLLILLALCYWPARTAFTAGEAKGVR